jgi:hypothetical protein
MRKALMQNNDTVRIVHTVDDALRIVSRNGSELELVAIDFDHGSHGVTLISAIKTSCDRLLILALRPTGDGFHRGRPDRTALPS